jgi:hypothetical protein
MKLNVDWPDALPQIVESATVSVDMFSVTCDGRAGDPKWVAMLKHNDTPGSEWMASTIVTAVCDTKEEAEAVAPLLKDLFYARSST